MPTTELPTISPMGKAALIGVSLLPLAPLAAPAIPILAGTAAGSALLSKPIPVVAKRSKTLQLPVEKAPKVYGKGAYRKPGGM